MKIDKNAILKNIYYTELVYERINKKLCSNFIKSEIETYVYEAIMETPLNNFEKIGKNFYIFNNEKKLKLTINSNIYRIITVDQIKH